MWCYISTCANDELIRLNKFVSRITDGFCNLPPHTTPTCNTWYDTSKLYTLHLNPIRGPMRMSSDRLCSASTALLLAADTPRSADISYCTNQSATAASCCRIRVIELLQQYFSANERCFSQTINQHKPNFSEQGGHFASFLICSNKQKSNPKVSKSFLDRR